MRMLTAFAAACLVLLGAARYLVDPLQIRDPSASPWTGRKFFYSLGTAANLLHKLDQGEKYSLVFGTSRSQRISPSILQTPTLNFGVLYGNPKSILPLLRQLGPRRMSNIKKIYYLLDGFSFKEKYVQSLDFNSPAALWRHELGTFGNEEILAAYETIRRNLTGKFDYYADPNGYYVDVRAGRFDPEIPISVFEDVTFSLDAVAALGEIDRFCKKNSIEIVYFTPPLTKLFFQALDFAPMAAIRKSYLKNIDSFYDLTYLEGISDEYSYFTDQSHLSAAGLKRIFEETLIPGSSEHRVSAANIDKQLRYLRDRHHPPR